MRKTLRIVSRLLLGLVLLVALALFLVHGWLSSQRGLDFLTRRGALLASSNDQQISIDGAYGRLFSDLGIRSVRISDAQGVWLELKGIHLIWQPAQFARSQQGIRALTVDAIIVTRLPQPSAVTSASSSDGGSMPSFRELASFLPRTVNLRDVWVRQEVAGVEQRLALTGGGDANRYQLHLATLGGQQATALDATVVPREKDFQFQLAFAEAPGGLVGALAGLPTDTSIDVQAQGAADAAGVIALSQAQVTMGTLVLQGTGRYQPRDRTVDTQFTLHAPDLGMLQTMTGTPANGSLDATIAAQGPLDKLHVNLTADSPHLMVDANAFDTVHVGMDGTVNAASDALHAEAQIEAHAQQGTIPVTLATHLTVAPTTLDVKEIDAHYGENALQGTLHAQGTSTKFDLKTDATFTRPEGSSTLAVVGSIDTATPHYEGTAKGSFTYLKETFELVTELDATRERANVKNFTLHGPGTDISASADIKIPDQLADGTVKVNAPDLTPLGHVIGMKLSGAAKADVTLSSADKKQHIRANASTEKLLVDTLRLARAELQMQTDDARALDTLNGSASLQGLQADTARVETLKAEAKGSLKQGLTVTLDGKGTLDNKPWNVTLAGKAAQPDETHANAQLTVLKGQYSGMPVQLQAPTSFQYAPEKSTLSPFSLALAGGTVKASGFATPAQVKGDLVISHLALDKLPMADLPKGTLEATVNLSGTVRAPIVTYKASSATTLSNVKLNLAANGDWKNGALRANATATSDQANASVNAMLAAPLSLMPFNAGLNDATKLTGSMKAHVPLSMFNGQLRPSGNRIEGTFAGQAKLMGTLGAPSFDGRFNLTDGSYDQVDSGVCLRHMEATVTGTPQAVKLERFGATDSNEHHFNASGSLALAGAQAINGRAQFDHFRLFCGGLASGNVDGGITARGTTQAMTIGGKLTLGPLNVQIPGNRQASNIPSVPSIWVVPGQKMAHTAAKPSVIALDIGLHVPEQLFVRGRGLDAEFAGDLRIDGTVNTPQIEGRLEKRRGKFNLFDRVLTLDTATLTFQGPMPPSPFLDVAAETTVTTTTINVALAGSAAKPQITLSSTPTLPQDELLALLLFGRQLDKISPFQAVKLAQATRELAGYDDGPGLLGNLRSTLGLDTLDVGTDAENNVNVTTGKYITDKLFVGVTQGALPEDRKVTTEINLTPSVSGKTSIGADGNQSVGFDWKHDY